MKVLFIPSWYPINSNPLAGVFFKEQALALAENGVNISVLFPEIYNMRNLKLSFFESGMVKHEEEEGIEELRKKGFCVHPRLPYLEEKLFKSYLFDLYNMYKDKYGKPDIIHAHSFIWAGISSLELGVQENIPVIVTEHSSVHGLNKINNRKKTLTRYSINNVNQVIAVSSHLKEVLEKSYSPKKIIKVIPNMVDSEFFKPKPINTEDDSFVFLSASFLSYNKGHDILIKAFAAAFANDKKVKLKIAGKGKYLDKLKELVNECGVKDQVIFMGELNRNQIREEFNKCNAFVLASRYETFGMVYIEALSCGKPIIATDSGGPRDIVDKYNGILIPNQNQDSLIAALIEMKKNYYIFNSDIIRENTKSKFGKQNIAQEIIKVYEENINQNGK